MSHPIYRVRSFQIEGPYLLRVQFDDDSEQLIDFHPVVAGEPFGPLRDLAIFNQGRIDPEVHTLVCRMAPISISATLHDCPRFADAMAERAKQWELSNDAVR